MGAYTLSIAHTLPPFLSLSHTHTPSLPSFLSLSLSTILTVFIHNTRAVQTQTYFLDLFVEVCLCLFTVNNRMTPAVMRLWPTHTHTLIHTHTHSYTHTHTLIHTHTPFLSLTHTLSVTHTHTLSHTHTHTHTHTHSYVSSEHLQRLKVFVLIDWHVSRQHIQILITQTAHWWQCGRSLDTYSRTKPSKP